MLIDEKWLNTRSSQWAFVLRWQTMKNYFNQYEASNHLILMSAMITTKNFIDGNCITDEERKMLKKVLKLVDEFLLKRSQFFHLKQN